MEFKSADCTIEHIAFGKETESDERVTTTTLKMEAIVDATVLRQFAPGDPGDDIIDALYDDQGSPKFLGIGSIKFPYEFKDLRLTVSNGREYTFEDVILRKNIEAEPLDGLKAKLTIRCLIQPNQEQSGWLSEKFRENVTIELVSLAPPQGALGLEPTPDEKKEPVKKAATAKRTSKPSPQGKKKAKSRHTASSKPKPADPDGDDGGFSEDFKVSELE